MKFLSSLLLIGLLFSCGGNEVSTRFLIANSSHNLQEIVFSRKIPKGQLRIVVRKAARTLSVYFKDELLITYPCVLGFDPVGDKMQEGDGRTPEGNFAIRSMYGHKSWSYFIWFDYPNRVSQERFNQRKKSGAIPADATIGGDVGIHGVPAGRNDLIEKTSDWTLGCISLATENITDLYKSISTKTSIEILK
jgi:murein L,D-transpeptidase YafK